MGKDRSDEALKILHKLRRKEDVDSGLCEVEIASFMEEIEVGQRFVKKQSWIALFNRKNRRRTGYVLHISHNIILGMCTSTKD